MESTGAPSAAPFPWRRLARIAVAGTVATGLVAAAGTALHGVRYGTTTASARARVQDDVRGEFDRMARRLRDMGRAAAETPADIRLAADGDTTAARRLFDRIGAIVAADPSPDVAVTVYSSRARALAWAGRPSELPADRFRNGESWFIAQGAIGLRLVYVMPVGPSDTGIVVSERALTTDLDAVRAGPSAPGRAGRFTIASLRVPVAIELPFEGARAVSDASAFEVASPSGQRLLTAIASDTDIALAREALRRRTAAAALSMAAVSLLLVVGPLLDWRRAARASRPYVTATLAVVAVLVAARWMLTIAVAGLDSTAPALSSTLYGSPHVVPLLASPVDFLLTVLTAGGLVAVLAFALDAWRLQGARRPLPGGPALGRELAADLASGAAATLVIVGYITFLSDTVTHATADLLRFSLSPWDLGAVALQGGLVVAHAAAMALVVVALSAGLVLWRRAESGRIGTARTVLCWIAPAVAAAGLSVPSSRFPLLVPALVAMAVALAGGRLRARYRHGSQAFRLAVVIVAIIGPSLAFYPAVFDLARQAKVIEVESRFAEQALNQRQVVQTQLRQSLSQIDRFAGLADLIAAPPPLPGEGAETDRAFQVWQTTSLASYPVTSSVELYGPDGGLVSRFAFNLPEDLSVASQSEERACDWEVYEEVAPFFAEERRVLHAGRAVCPDGTLAGARGSIVVHAMLDYENLPFIASRNPYVELLRPAGAPSDALVRGRDVEYAVYGWSRTPLYSSRDRAWTLDDAVFARVETDRTPIWTTLYRGTEPYRVYLLNDRGGIYALGFPAVSALGHAANLAELIVLGALVALALLLGSAAFGWLLHRASTAKELLREVRASFYRKLFLAFVAAVAVPVVLLAIVTRASVADQMRASVEREALRTAFSAGRVVEDLVAPRAVQQGASVDDNLMVWVSRLIDQDSNIFIGSRLAATSERNLFASGLLPTRTQADVFRALALRREAAVVVREQIAGFEYLVAAAPLTVGAEDAVLTVPLTSRQRDIDAEIDALDRRVLLAALLFLLAGAGLGYSMAERIADPVSRLTRATRRIAGGDLDARIAVTSSDEFRRLVGDFNRMADQLQRQRAELERTNRIEAWAEMARQVAHEIKNPLTPIQLNAEHLRRVHADRGEPLGGIVRDCVEAILTQVRLLRRIASEFSTFAASPTAKPSRVDVAEMLAEIVEPYRLGLEARVRFDLHLAPDLPAIHVDRTLVGRAVTNLVENALHAMPGAGTVTVAAWAEDDGVHVRVADTGAGMDAEALARAFEPYFSTKASGTGLGLPIAKRNVELNGGRLSIASERDRGTSVEIVFPGAEVPPAT